MFVFLERDVRAKRSIPWYLHWLSFDVLRRRTERHFECSLKENLLLNGHVRNGLQEKAREVAVSLLSLIPRATSTSTPYQFNIPPPPPSQV
ncbi:Neurotransmitter-gated ion-channel transmembrane region [Parelaphostrongylus tenuis]|uniref:Neurotransmitter-gated ion-channel transmembrane region n=1 Tax=Parelaphostrongylus tenuis TaxID=148309 RepID=A0AAD5MGH8_PARTN|nr:Neurotransmitter-gated ion-channel transmembrane region [Parelaphostrongylus tenuis]